MITVDYFGETCPQQSNEACAVNDLESLPSVANLQTEYVSAPLRPQSTLNPTIAAYAAIQYL